MRVKSLDSSTAAPSPLVRALFLRAVLAGHGAELRDREMWRSHASLWLMACQLLAPSSGAFVTLAASRSRASNRGATGRSGRCRMSTPSLIFTIALEIAQRSVLDIGVQYFFVNYR